MSDELRTRVYAAVAGVLIVAVWLAFMGSVIEGVVR